MKVIVEPYDGTKDPHYHLKARQWAGEMTPSNVNNSMLLNI